MLYFIFISIFIFSVFYFFIFVIIIFFFVLSVYPFYFVKQTSNLFVTSVTSENVYEDIYVKTNKNLNDKKKRKGLSTSCKSISIFHSGLTCKTELNLRK